MFGTQAKYKCKSDKYKYVYVYEVHKDKSLWYKAQIGRKSRNFRDEKAAAKWADIRLINEGKEPVNILKRK